MIRRVLAAVAGYLLFLVATLAVSKISEEDPNAPQSAIFIVLLSTVYGMIFAALGGYLAAKFGGTSPRYEGWLVAAAIVVGGVVSIARNDPPGMIHSQIVGIALMAPAAVWGARKVSLRSSVDEGPHRDL